MSDKNSDNRSRERLHESLSAVLDGQASDFELRRVLDGIHTDDGLRETAMRYQRIGDSIRRENSRFADIDLSAGIRAAIDSEPSYAADRSQAEQRWLLGSKTVRRLSSWSDSLGRVAVAASVVFAVVLGTRSYTTSQDVALVADAGLPSSTATLSQPIQVNHNGYAASGILAGYNSRQGEDSISPEQLAYAQSVADRATRERFRAYALQHAELSVMSTGQGVLPFARLTSFDVQ